MAIYSIFCKKIDKQYPKSHDTSCKKFYSNTFIKGCIGKEIFSAPLTDNQCQFLLDMVIDMQFAYSDDIADFEDVIEATADFFELFKSRLKGGGKNECFKALGTFDIST